MRFKVTVNPVGAIATYLRSIADEAEQRKYHFDRNKIINEIFDGLIPVTIGQLEYEFQHLLGKLKKRDLVKHARLIEVIEIKPHPIFNQISGNREDWEVVPITVIS
jgi:hypothetical protein